MSNTRKYITIILTLIVLILIGWSLTDQSDSMPSVNASAQEPAYRSQYSNSRIYDPTGKLQYTLVADEVMYYPDKEYGLFQRPLMTLYDQKAVAIWSVNSDKARLTKDSMLYLNGNVKVNSLTPDSQLKKITTNNAEINLVTQDVSSDDEVTLSGTGFSSNGMKMRGNLRKRSAELIEKVTTRYEIQQQQKTQ